jgi:hypothetical protein
MKIAWICGLLVLLSSAAYDWYPAPVSAAAEPKREARDISAYVNLHQTRNDFSSSDCN